MDVAQDEHCRDGQDRYHEQRDAGAERKVVALNADPERPGGEHMRAVDRPAGGEDAHDVEIGERHDQENGAVMAMMLRIIGSVTYHMRCHQLAPSIAAAS